MSSRPAAFFDRDGVVNLSPGPGYVENPAAFHLAPGITECLRACRAAGFVTVLVTNQQGVGKGIMTQADLDAVHQHMQERLGREAAFDAIYACTHLAGSCSCRKPSPEMIERAVAEHNLDLQRSFMVGDHDRDIEMGERAGVATTIRVRGEKPIGRQADHTVDSAEELAKLVPTVLHSLAER